MSAESGHLAPWASPGVLLRPSRWSLRARLLGALVALLALVCLALGVASAVALEHFLVDRLDDQLTSAGGRAVDSDRRRGGGPDDQDGPFDRGDGPSDDVLLGPVQAPGTLGVRVTDGQVTEAGILTDQGALRQVAVSAVSGLASLPARGGPSTVTLPGLGDYRVLASTSSTSSTVGTGDRGADGDDVVVTGLPLAGVHDTVFWLVGLQAVLSGAALLGAGCAAAKIVQRTLQPLHRVATLATHVTDLPLSRGEVELAERVPVADTDPRTEVGQVGAALNQLLDHVGSALSARQASETRVRQFVADASHELRTPLAAIRGYAELTRRSDQPVPDDVAYALGRVESEATRMTSLVEDLLLLARLDSGRPLDHEPVDLTRLVVDAVSDASVAGPDHAWRLDLPEEPVEVLGDQARLHQVLANLLANARTHTPPGTTVTASLSARAGDADLAVIDDGPGIEPGLLPHVFQRFARGDGSRTRGAGSTGLGLAIVQAVLNAHGGSIDVHSRPGRTTFHVRLPARAPDDASALRVTGVPERLDRHQSAAIVSHGRQT